MNEVDFPFVSVVMPVRNEAHFITESLSAVLNQDYPGDRMEVIVVDGDSTDGTRELVGAYQRTDPRLLLLRNPQRIVPVGLNIGIRHARGDVVVRVDGHAVIASDYVRKCAQYLQRGDVDNVGGLMRPEGKTYFGRSAALATSSPFGIGNSPFHYAEREQFVDTVYLGAYRRAIFDRIGLFDEKLVCNQDYELNYRLRQAGGRILCSPQIRSVYYCRDSLRALFRQYFQYGWWKVETLRRHPRSLKVRQFAAPLLVLGIAALAVLGLFTRFAWTLLALGMVLYLGLGSAFALSQAVKARSFRLWPGILLGFLVLHLAWGLGFWRRVLASPPSRRGAEGSPK